MPNHERAARLKLSCAGEPGDEKLGRRLQAVGAVDLVGEITRGESSLPNADWLKTRLFALDSNPIKIRPGQRYLTPEDQDWPAELNDLGSRTPIGLFVMGHHNLAELLATSISVVGTRSASGYGRLATNELCSELAYQGVCVVSGAAFGIDAVAHRAALGVGGQTLAVLAGGVGDDYPTAHADLLAEIREKGLAISEVPDGSHPTRPRFLQRNRIIAALTPATLVVEAPIRSGALSTARWASALLRLVMAVPGSINAPMSAGVNRLIKDREAELVTSPNEVFECLAAIGENMLSAPSSPENAIDRLVGVDAAVIEALPASRGLSLEQLASELSAPTNEIAAALGRLQLQGLVRRGAKGWAVVRHALYRNT